MAKGYEANLARLAAVNALGKQLAKRAAFKCEWCGGGTDLRPQDLDPTEEPSPETVALLCEPCRALHSGKKGDKAHARSLVGAVWHQEPRVAAEAARVLLRTGEDWAREAVDDCNLDDEIKASLYREAPGR